MLGGAAVPRDRFGGILRHADALGVHRPKVALRAGVALLGGAAVPRDRSAASCGTDALGVYHPEVVLRARLALLGGAAVPRDRFCGILRHADAGGIHVAEDELRLGAGAEGCEGLCGWAVFILCLNTGCEGGDHEGDTHNGATHLRLLSFMFWAKPKASLRPYQTPEPQPWGAVTRRAVAQRRSRASGLTRLSA